MLSTFELEELDELENRDAAAGFDFHDTIPAPPWLDEFGEAENELQALLPVPRADPALYERERNVSVPPSGGYAVVDPHSRLVSLCSIVVRHQPGAAEFRPR